MSVQTCPILLDDLHSSLLVSNFQSYRVTGHAIFSSGEGNRGIGSGIECVSTQPGHDEGETFTGSTGSEKLLTTGAPETKLDAGCFKASSILAGVQYSLIVLGDESSSCWTIPWAANRPDGRERRIPRSRNPMPGRTIIGTNNTITQVRYFFANSER